MKAKPLQIVISKSKGRYRAFSQSLKGVEDSREDMSLEDVAKFIKAAKLSESAKAS